MTIVAKRRSVRATCKNAARSPFLEILSCVLGRASLRRDVSQQRPSPPKTRHCGDKRRRRRRKRRERRRRRRRCCYRLVCAHRAAETAAACHSASARVLNKFVTRHKNIDRLFCIFATLLARHRLLRVAVHRSTTRSRASKRAFGRWNSAMCARA